DEARRISRAARGDVIPDVDAGDAPAGVDDFAHREPAAVGQIVGATVPGSGAEEVFHGEQVGAADVGDVDVVANTGAVGRVVVVSENFERGVSGRAAVPDADGLVQCQRYE